MAFDEELAERVRASLAKVRGVTEIKMFGGLCFTVRGNMAIGVHEENLIVRVSPEVGEVALRKKHVRPFDLTGRPMRGLLYVAPEGLRTLRMLQGWVDAGVAFASSLPPKKAKQRASRTAAGRR